MSERHEVISKLDEAGVLAGIRWAYESATDRVLDDYSEAAGHNAHWVGNTRWVLFCDRLDRVFSCGKYEVPVGGDKQANLDLVFGELPKRDIDTLPDLAPELVRTANLNGSPGWAYGDVRWLLSSAPYGKLKTMSWEQKSETKQLVAQQPSEDSDEPTLFEEFGELDMPFPAKDVDVVSPLDLRTFIVGHTIDVVGGGRELVLGQPRQKAAQESSWHWMHDLLEGPGGAGGRFQPGKPVLVGPDTTPDAPVKLRRRDTGTGADRKGQVS